MRNSLIIILFLFCGVYSYSQNITIDGNGTVRCPKTGRLLPAGSYYYLVEVQETGKVKKGWLYLTY